MPSRIEMLASHQIARVDQPRANYLVLRLGAPSQSRFEGKHDGARRRVVSSVAVRMVARKPTLCKHNTQQKQVAKATRQLVATLKNCKVNSRRYSNFQYLGEQGNCPVSASFGCSPMFTG